MSETQHDAIDDGFHEIQLSGKQLVFLFMATTIVAVFIFLCGVQVGRNVKGGDRAASAEPVDTAAAQTAAPPPASASTQATPSSGPPAAEPPAPEPDDELSYAKRLQQADPAAGDKLPSSPPAPAATADRHPAEKPAPKAAAPVVAQAKPQSAPAAQGRPGKWIVQLTAIKDRDQAAKDARDLVAKGYPAFVLDPAPGAPAIYRVQVGGYPDRDNALQVAKKLEREQHFNPYVRAR